MVKLSERLKNIKDIEYDNDICRLIILEMNRFHDGFDYFQCDNELELKVLSNYFDLNIPLQINYPITAKLYFDYNPNLSLRSISYTIENGVIKNDS